MKKSLLMGTVLVLATMLFFSCNKNRFNYDHLNSVEGSGQWKLPIGSAHATIGDVLKQFSENDLVTYDENGNLKIEQHFEMSNPILGSDIINLKDTVYTDRMTSINPYPFVLPEPVDAIIPQSMKILVHSDDIHLDYAKFKSGHLSLTITSNTGLLGINLQIPGILTANNTPLEVDLDVQTGNPTLIPLNGCVIETIGDSLELNFQIHYQIQNLLDPDLIFDATLGLHSVEIEELRGEIDTYSVPLALDTAFELPFNDVEGQLSIVDAQLRIFRINTFGLGARLVIDTAMLYGEGIAPSYIFDVSSPTVVEINSSNSEEFTLAMEKDVDLSIDTRINSILLAGDLILNPEGFNNQVSINSSSKFALAIDAIVPMKFNIPGVTYLDTIDINLGALEMPELISEVLMNVSLSSEMPFNLEAQLYLYDSQNDEILGSLTDEYMLIGGCYDGTPVVSDVDLSITQNKLQDLMKADKILMKIGINTDNHDVVLNLQDGLQLTIKADVVYGGGVDFNN